MKTFVAVDNQTIAAGTTYNGNVFYPSFVDDEDGIIQIGTITTVGGTATIKLQGRLLATAPWVDVALGAGTSATAAGYFLVPMFPEMRVTVAAATAQVSLSVWVGD